MRRKTINEIRNEIKKLTKNEYSVESDIYENNKTKITFKHKTCGRTFEMSLNKFLSGHRCPNCSKMRQKTLKEMREMIRAKNPEMYLIDGYNGSTKPARFYHIDCEREFIATPTEILNGKRCPFCYNKQTGESERFQNILNRQFNNEILLVERYHGMKQKTRFICNHCGTKFTVKPELLLKYNRCPLCKDADAKNKIERFLTTAEIDYIQNETIFQGYIMKFDFYIPEMNLAIDYNGEFYYDHLKGFSSDTKERYKKKMKEVYCKENDIKLLRIPFWKKDEIDEILYSLFLVIDEESSLTKFNKWRQAENLRNI